MSAAFQFLLLRCVDDYTSRSEKQYSCAIPRNTSDAAIEERLEMLQLELDTDRCKLDDLFQRLHDLIGRWKQQVHALPEDSSVRSDASSAFYSFAYAHNLLRLLPAVSKLQCSIVELIHGSAPRHAEPTIDPYGSTLEDRPPQTYLPSGRNLQQPGSADPTNPANEPSGSTPSMPPRHKQHVSSASMGPQQRRRAAVHLLKCYAHLSHAKQRFLDRPASIKHRRILSRRKWFLRCCTCHRCRWTGPWTRRYYPTRREMDRLYGTSVPRNKRACNRRQYAGAPFDPGSITEVQQSTSVLSTPAWSQHLYAETPFDPGCVQLVQPDIVLGREHAWLWDQLVRNSIEELSSASRRVNRDPSTPSGVSSPPAGGPDATQSSGYCGVASAVHMDEDLREQLEHLIAKNVAHDKYGNVLGLGYTADANPFSAGEGRPRKD